MLLLLLFLEQSVPTEFYVALSQGRLDGGVIVIYSDFRMLFIYFHHFPLPTTRSHSF